MSKLMIIGASGLTGQFLVTRALNDDYFSEIIVFVRKSLNIHHSKLKEHLIDFNQLERYHDLMRADYAACCMGTTIKTAGSQEAFKRVDFDYPLKFAELARQNGCQGFFLQSSLGANSSSSNFYLRTKGEIETAIKALGFNHYAVFRPSMLLGPRTESRLGESIGKVIMQAMSFLFVGSLKRYKAIHVKDVAAAMIKEMKENTSGFKVFENEMMLP